MEFSPIIGPPPPPAASHADDERAATSKDRKIGQRVRTRRLEIGMSQETLAELLGVSFQQVQKYEKGVNRIASGRLHDIAIALKHPIAAFFEGLDSAIDANSEVADSLATADGIKMAALFARVRSPALRRKLFSLAETLAEEDSTS